MTSFNIAIPEPGVVALGVLALGAMLLRRRMKLLVTTMVAVAAAGTAFAQGTVNFANRVGSGTNTLMLTPIYGPNPASPIRAHQGNATTNINPGSVDYTGHPLLVGTGFTAALFGGAVGTAPEALSFVASSRFRPPGTLGGIWAALTGIAPGVPGAGPGGNATLQVRVWDNVGGTVNSWAQVLGGPPGVARGVSAPFTAFGLGDPNNATKLPANLVVTDPTSPNFGAGMTSFSLCCPIPVPEPGIIALGVLGLGALLLRRSQ